MSGVFLYITASALCLGVASALLFPLGTWAVCLVFGTALALLGVAALMRMPALFLVALAVASFGLGVVRGDFMLAREARETLPRYIGEKVVVAGVVAQDPDARDTSLHVTLDVQEIDDAPASGKLLVLLKPGALVSYGDTIIVQGTPKAPESFETDTGHTFDYPGYLRAQGISATMSYASVLGKQPGGWSLLGFLFWLKHAFEHSLERLFPEPDGSLLQGLLLGEKHGISELLTAAFVASGLVHIVVLSGYNISIVAEGMFRALAFLPRAASFSLGGVMMVLFALMTGAGAATVRALCMALVALLARYLRRSALALRSLCVAATLMVLWNPEGLLHDTSFILSVLATFGLVTLSPWVENYLASFKLFRKKRMQGTRSILASTIAVEIFVLPALLYFSGVLSLLSLPANVLALPVIPATMLFGFAAGLLGLGAPLLGLLPAFVADVLLKWILVVVATVATIPHSTIIVSQFSPWFLALLYIPLTWFAISRYTFSSASSSRAHRSDFR